MLGLSKFNVSCIPSGSRNWMCFHENATCTICSLHQHGSLSAWSNMLLQIFIFLVCLYMHIQTSYNVNSLHLVASVMSTTSPWFYFLPAEIPHGSKHHGCPFHDIILQGRGTNTSSVPVSGEKKWPVMGQGILWDTFGWMFEKEMTHG